MSKHDKTLLKLQRQPAPKNITYDEVENLLLNLGYAKDNKGKTSGSSVAFVGKRVPILLHKPHPRKELLQYQVKDIVAKLRQEGIIT